MRIIKKIFLIPSYPFQILSILVGVIYFVCTTPLVDGMTNLDNSIRERKEEIHSVMRIVTPKGFDWFISIAFYLFMIYKFLI